MRPQSFRPPMPPSHPFNNFQGPRGGFGSRPPQFPRQGMVPPPGRGLGHGPGPGPGAGPGLGTALGAAGTAPRLQSFMDTANRFLATAQSFQPLVQQATPMIRNLPALWRLYKGFQGLPKDQNPNGQMRNEEFNLDDSLDIPERFEHTERHEGPMKEERFEGPMRAERYEAPMAEPQRPARAPGPRQERFARQERPGRRYDQYDLESPAYNEAMKPKKASPRPSMPRIFQPPYDFGE